MAQRNTCGLGNLLGYSMAQFYAFSLTHRCPTWLKLSRCSFNVSNLAHVALMCPTWLKLSRCSFNLSNLAHVALMCPTWLKLSSCSFNLAQVIQV